MYKNQKTIANLHKFTSYKLKFIQYLCCFYVPHVLCTYSGGNVEDLDCSFNA